MSKRLVLVNLVTKLHFVRNYAFYQYLLYNVHVLCIIVSSSFEFQVGHSNLSTALTTDQKWIFFSYQFCKELLKIANCKFLVKLDKFIWKKVILGTSCWLLSFFKSAPCIILVSGQSCSLVLIPDLKFKSWILSNLCDVQYNGVW